MKKLVLATLFLSLLAGAIGIGLGLFLQAQAKKNHALEGGMADGSAADDAPSDAIGAGGADGAEGAETSDASSGSTEPRDTADTASTPRIRATPVVMDAQPAPTRRRTVASSSSPKKKTARTNTTITASDPGDPGEASDPGESSLLDALSDDSLPTAEDEKGGSTASMVVAKAEIAFPSSTGGVSIKKVIQKQQGPTLQIIIEFTGAVPKHKVFRVKNPARIYVDFEQLEIPGGDKTAPGAGGRVKEIGVRAMTGADAITRVQIRLDDAGDVLPKVSESATESVLTLVIAPNIDA